MNIGEASQRAGVSVQTMRYYVRRGMVSPPARAANGYRMYGEETVARVRWIKRAQSLGFSLDDIERLLRFREDAIGCAELKPWVQEHIATLERRIAQLQHDRDELLALCEVCTGSPCASLQATGGAEAP